MHIHHLDTVSYIDNDDEHNDQHVSLLYEPPVSQDILSELL